MSGVSRQEKELPGKPLIPGFSLGEALTSQMAKNMVRLNSMKILLYLG